MLRALWTAASGMNAQQVNIDTIANNLANVNTAGFKRSRVDFQDVLYQTDRVPGSASARGSQLPTGIQVGLGTRPGAVYKLFSQGTFTATGNNLDVAIEGNGFLPVVLPGGGTAYTRDGGLKLDTQGRIVTADGYPLEPELTIPAEAMEVAIGQDGTVSVKLPGQDAMQEVGQLQLASFVNPSGLESIGRNLFSGTPASGDAQTGAPMTGNLGSIVQGYLEQSNVDVVQEMVQMIVAMRAYEVNSKAIQTSDEMLQVANQVRR
ncbi:MAG: flagellar basal-body rod protein FlgG [Fimbriimonadaceae bacterium]|nr:flagellar basal-body rod protein FlgG [Fimbriimonadaceae bacterium]